MTYDRISTEARREEDARRAARLPQVIANLSDEALAYYAARGHQRTMSAMAKTEIARRARGAARA